jgi:hypothetical protein
MIFRKRIAFFALSALIFTGCTSEQKEKDGNGNGPVEAIEWDQATAQRVTAGGYARVKKLSNGELILVYQAGGNAQCRIKGSSGRWGNPILVGSDSAGHYDYANSEALELADGRILYAWNARQKNQDSALYPYKIMIAESNNKGRTWSAGRDLYQAGRRFDEGCWEPSLLQLPSGEVQLYFANEGVYPTSHEQNISMLRSFDSGRTWSTPEVVSFRAGKRDGMPVPVYLQNNKGIVIAIEDNAVNTFKPYIVHSSVENNWRSGAVLGNSPNRWQALREDARPPNSAYVGAPYLIQLNSGETVLSVQSSEGRSGQGTEYSLMEVYIGDAEAKNFAGKTKPFHREEPGHALWNSLCQIDDNTILAVTQITGMATAENGIWIIEGHIKRN